ncbi:MAG: radical SAM protein [Eubacteriales bacterium]|nr:radical SAM protein [Eubacteriales bacterium]MDD3349407.1 radical SAM protein [Eubacteriales bacterium]
MKKLLSETKSICPICLKTIAAQRVSENGKVYLQKECAEHGSFRALIWGDETSYLGFKTQEINTRPEVFERSPEKGCPHDCGLCTEHKQQACCIVLELTQKCNQNCHYCFASSSEQIQSGEEPSLAEIKQTLLDLLKKSGDRPFNLQLSGGEPTLREDLFEIIKMAKELGYPYIQLNTNGMKLTEPGYCEALAAAGLSSVFLQFDGTTEAIYEKIRGQNLLEIKKKALNEIKQAGLSAVLVVTVVPGANEDTIGDIIDFAAKGLPYIRGIHFQPVSYMGRFPAEPQDKDRITLDRLIELIEEQTQGAMKRSQFLPLSSGNCYCSFHGRFVYTKEGSFLPISANPTQACCEKMAIIKARNFIEKQWEWSPDEYRVQDGSKNEYEEADMTDFDYFTERVTNFGMSITAMGFQDRWNLDLERLQKCRVHIATKEGTLIPFCSYYNIHK